MPSETIQRKLLNTAARDIEELLPQLEPRAAELAALAIEKLKQRGAREEKDLRETLERQRARVLEELVKYDKGELDTAMRLEKEERSLRQVPLFEQDRQRQAEAKRRLEQAKREIEDAKRQLELDVRSWRNRLQQFDRDLQHEPQRIRSFYEVRAKRVEPVGLVYLWPESN